MPRMAAYVQTVQRYVVRPVCMTFALHSTHTQVPAIEVQMANSNIAGIDDADRVVSGPCHKYRAGFFLWSRKQDRRLPRAIKVMEREAILVYSRHQAHLIARRQTLQYASIGVWADVVNQAESKAGSARHPR